MKIEKKHSTAIFCTCSERNRSVYLNRVKKWYAMLSPIHEEADFYCISDGTLNGENSELSDKIHFLELPPALGRINVGNFPGWKRSYGKALEVLSGAGYSEIIHIENDIIILNWDKFKKYWKRSGLYSSWNRQYGFIESAFQILNDPETVEKLKKRYTSLAGIAENSLFELELQKFPFQYPFLSLRMETFLSTLVTNLDFSAQSYNL